VAKEELSRWPVFGTAMRDLGMVLVKRESSSSRQSAADAIARCLLEQKRSVALFPAGTTHMDEAIEWRLGGFRIAHQHRIPIQPFRLRFKPLREVAYIDDDTFLFHIWKLLDVPNVEASLELAEPCYVTDPVQDAAKWRAWCREPEAPNKTLEQAKRADQVRQVETVSTAE
jgi:1-acyl-sn-glycerol-3-phosphate acyltransferase